MTWGMILLLGLSNLVANALNLGIGEYLSSKAHQEFVLAEKRRALWEFKHFRGAEVDQVNSLRMTSWSLILAVACADGT